MVAQREGYEEYEVFEQPEDEYQGFEPAKPREVILNAARQAVVGQREQEYGTPQDSFQMIANYWNVFLLGKQGQQLTPSDVALMMDLLKTTRLQMGAGSEDTWMDKAGYAAVGYEVWLGKDTQ